LANKYDDDDDEVAISRPHH